MQNIILTTEESGVIRTQNAYWDGFVAGATAAADHAKRLALTKVIQSRQTTAPPAQPEPPKE